MRIKDQVRDRFVPIDNIYNGTNFLNVMNNYLSNHQRNIAHQQKQNKLLKIRHFTLQNRIFSGIVENGHPLFESINEISLGLLQDLLRQIRRENDVR